MKIRNRIEKPSHSEEAPIFRGAESGQKQKPGKGGGGGEGGDAAASKTMTK